MAINEELIECLTQDDVFNNSDLGSVVGYENEGKAPPKEEECNSFKRVSRLKLRVLESLWRNADTKVRRELRDKESSLSLKKDLDEKHESESSSFSAKLPLLLLIPLLESQAKSDPSLVEQTTSILFEFLKECLPLSSSDQAQQLDSLEELLLRWCSPFSSNVASALVALACSKRSLKTLVKTIYLLLQSKGQKCKLPVGPVVKALTPYESEPHPPIPNQISEQWRIKDYFDLNYAYDDQNDEYRRRRLAVSPSYMYLFSGNEGLVKIGNGRNGSIRGHIYATNPSLEKGFPAFAQGHLIFHSANEKFQILDSNTLQEKRELKIDSELLIKGSETLHFLSDGAQFFLIRSSPLPHQEEEAEEEQEQGEENEKINYELSITLDVFEIQPDEESIKPSRERVILSRRDEGRLSSSKKSTSSQGPSDRKNNLYTSTGLDIKTLFQAPVLTCGNYVSFLTYNNTLPSHRSVFGNKVLGGGGYTAYSFSVQNGEFHGKNDFTEAFSSNKQFQKKLLLRSSTSAYDTFNDLIWIVYSGGVVGLTSSNFKSLAYIKNSLHIPLQVPNLSDALCVDEVRRELLRRAALLSSIPNKERNDSSSQTNIESELIIILQDSLKEKDRESSFCILKIISKFHFPFPLDKLMSQLKEDPLLLDFAYDTFLATMKDDDDEQLSQLLSSRTLDPRLKNKLYISLSSFKAMDSKRLLKMIRHEEFVDSLVLDSIQESLQVFQSKDVDLHHPKTSPLLLFLTNFISRYAFFTLNEEEGYECESFIQNCNKIIRVIQDKVLRDFLIPSKTFENKDFDKLVKSTVLGTFFQTIIAALSHPKFQILGVIKEISEEIISLWKFICEIASAQWKNKNKCTFVGKEMGFLSTVPEMDSWEPCRVIESPHPIKNIYKHEESINIPNASVIYLKFDSRCSLEPEDKFTILRWNRVLVEFTQNSWPDTEYRIDWPTSITIKFETKGRNKVWGFRILVSEYLSQLQSINLSLPHMTEAGLSVSSLLHTYMNILYVGPEISVHEEKSRSLLGLKLLGRCIWNRESQSIARIRLLKSIVTKMRDLTGIKIPPLRPSVKEALGIEPLEEGILASVMKHLSLFEVVEDLSTHERNQTPEYLTLVDMLGQTHRRINALIRRLQILADLENQWELEIDCLKDGSVSYEDIFFREYHLNETRWKELTLLGFLKGIEVNDNKRERAVNDLLRVMEREMIQYGSNEDPFSRTKTVVNGIMEKIELLLKISINIEESSSNLMTQSLISWPDSITKKKKFLERERSLDDSILQIPLLKKNHVTSKFESKKSTEAEILDEIFAFIGSNPEKAVSQSSFLNAIQTRQSRYESRNLSIIHTKEILSSAKKFEIGSRMASSFISNIKDGLNTEEIYFGANSIDEIRENFIELTSILTGISSQYYHSSTFVIETLCQIPYEKDDEICLIRNGLVNLLSVLCCDKANSELAWKGFKCLANRCVSWEQSVEDEDGEEKKMEKVSQDEFGLARQLSIVLTNHLVRVTSSYDEKRNESLEEIISLLAFMSKCQTGKDMLSQPSCISDLLELLLEPMSPKMILEIVQLCYIGLPRMSRESVKRVDIPKWNLGFSTCEEDQSEESHLKRILNLILAKLSDYLVPGSQVTSVFTIKPTKSSRRDSFVPHGTHSLIMENVSSTATIDRGIMALYVHKKSKNQTAHEIIQLLLNVNSEVKLFPLGGNTSNMDKVVKMDKDLTKHNKAEVLCGDASLIFHKGTKLAQLGFIISVSSKINDNQDSQACRDKNILLSRTDPVRPFISSYVAHSIATKLVSLIHSLAQSLVWKDALISLLKKNLERLQCMVKSTESLYDLDNPMELFKFYALGRKVLATLSIIGAFECQLKSGDEVIIESTQDVDKILTIDEDLGLATLCRSGEMLLKRLKPINRLDQQGKELFSQFILNALVDSFHILLTPDSEIGIDPLSAALPANGDGWSLKLAVSRVLAEIRTKSCQLLALYSNDEEFILAFMRKSYQAIDMLKLVSKDVLPTDDLDLIQRKLKNLKSIYRDCFKPPIPSSRSSQASSNKSETAWNTLISFPPISSTIFSYSMTGVAYHGDPVHSPTLPRGVFIYANSNSVSYFEISILSLGEVETQSESSSTVLSIGVSPLCEEKDNDDPWTNPIGSVFIHNNGRMVHYCGESLLQWKSVKLDHAFRQGDVIGVLMEEGKVQFAINGAFLTNQSFEDVGQDLFPAIHILKKGVQIKANFGNGGPFKFEEQNRKLINLRRESLRVEEEAPCAKDSNGEMYSFLQFDVTTKIECPGAAGHRRLSNVPSRNALRIKTESDYDFRESSYFHSSPNAIPAFKSGVYDPRFKKPLDDDSDDDNFDDDLETRHVHEDLNSLVVKSWETKIFPIIRRRFRNDSERQDGLEQIKGALSLGMTDIARQTVEFLYEESGGIPQDLHLPTIEDIKEDLSKLSIDGIKKGMIVNIGSINEELGYKIGPESIFETSLHSGEVLDVDTDNELIQVEAYLKLKGVLVRYWYPLCALEKSSQNNNSASSNICPINTGSFDIHNPDIHREVLNMEFALSRIYCRSAYISLLLLSTQLDLNDLDFENENESILSSVMMLQDPDIENLRLLSESLFRKSDIHGNILDTNIAIHESQSLFDLSSNQFRRLFYSDEGKLIQEIKRIIEKDGLQSEIIHELFTCLQSPDNYFITEEIEINDLSILKSLVRFESCAFVSVSCKYEEEALSQDDLAIQLQTLNGLVLKPNGRSSPRDIIQYPVDKKFPMLLLADEILQISHGGGGEEKRPSILLHGIHRDFPLVVCIIEVLLTLPPDNFTSSAGFDLISSLLSFLTKYSAPLIIKERLFVLILKCAKYFKVNLSKLKDNLALNGLFQELRHLHALESKEKDFSSYFVALADLLYYLSSDQECDSWFNDVKSLLTKLENWDRLEPNSEKIYPNDFDRLLILTGIHKSLSIEEIRSSILKIVDALGGTYKNSELFVPHTNPEERFAVLQVRFASKINQIKGELEKCPVLNHHLNEEDDDETEFTVTKFNSDIINNLKVNEALEKYLFHKIFQENGSPKVELAAILTNLNSKDLESLSKSLGIEIKDKNIAFKGFSPKVKLVKALMDIGFDLNLKNTLNGRTYSLKNQAILVQEVNDLCKDYSISPFDIHPNETYESRYELKALQELNKAVSKTKLLSKISFRNVDNGDKVQVLRSLVFTCVKTEFFNSKLIMLRNQSQPPPELSLNPVEDIGTTKEDSSQTWFVQAMKHLENVDSHQFCVNFATGGDPELPLNVKMIGEEVFGNSGSFRHFLSRITQELLSRAIPLFVPNLGSERKGLWTLKSDEGLSYNTEKYLKFFGQLIGMALRAGIPLALNLMPQNWKSLADCPLNDCDLRDFDPSTHNLISSIKNIKSQEEFEEFIEDYQFPKMTVLDVSGNERELIPDGGSTYLSWSNKNEYIEALKKFKMQEMSCTERWIHVKAGLASIIPMDIFLSLFRPSEIEAIICGPNKVNIRYIKEHTIYQVGLKESDAHVRYFWNVLETLSTSQIQKFIKFCCNQDRIQTWSEENLPPYPMKIAPANGNSDEDDDPDQRHIRVETCMFMIKLPRYSSYEIMRKKIIFAISSAMDPLSG